MNFLQNELQKFLVNLANSFKQNLDKNRSVDVKKDYIDGYDDGIRYCIENIEEYAELFKQQCKAIEQHNTDIVGSSITKLS